MTKRKNETAREKQPKPARRPKQPALGPKRAASEQIDRELAARALEKRTRGEAPTTAERAALKRVEAAREEQLRWHYYRTIPQKHWKQMSGKQTKQLHAQAATYGLPFGGAVVDLPEVVQALHAFLAENAPALAVARGKIGMGTAAEADRERKHYQAKREKLRYEKEAGEVIETAVAEEQRAAILRWIVGVMESAGSELAPKLAGRRPAAVRKIVTDYFDRVRREAVGRE